MSFAIYASFLIKDQPPVEYWMVLAEKRRLALIDSTKEKDDVRNEGVL